MDKLGTVPWPSSSAIMFMRKTVLFHFGFAAILLTSCGTPSAPSTAPSLPNGSSATSQWPGPQADGSVLLPNLWSLRPAGLQTLLGDFPVNMAVHPGGAYVAILHAGHSQHEIITVEIKSREIVSRVPVEEAFYGIAFDPRGERIYCSGAGDEVIHSFAFQNGFLSDHIAIPLRDAKLRGIPSGLAISKSGG